MKLGPLEAMMFGELCSESDYWYQNNGITEDGYFFSTVDNIENKLNIKKDVQQKLIKTLVNAGLLSVSKRGMPAKRYIKINEENLLNLLSVNAPTSGRNFRQQVDGISSSNKNISNKNIYISEGQGCPSQERIAMPPASKGKKSDFLPPTPEEVKKYIEEKKYNIDPVYFFEYYSADGWRDKNNKPIKNWKLKAFTWHKNNSKVSNPITETKTEPTIFDENFEVITREDYIHKMNEWRKSGRRNDK